MNITRESLLKKVSYKSKEYNIISLSEVLKNNPSFTKLSYSMRVILENLIRKAKNDTTLNLAIDQISKWLNEDKNQEINFYPARVLLQDFTGVPVIVDFVCMRDGATSIGADPSKINPLIRADLVVDHSVIVDHYGDNTALKKNINEEYKRNLERYEFLKWGQENFENFRVVPPGMGICHQVNLEYLGEVIFTGDKNKNHYLYPDTVIGTDSHTTMINGLGILGWGVGGIEAEAVMLGESISMVLPEVVGFKLIGKLKEGVTATDLVLTVTEILRKRGVVNKFVEFCGKGLKNLSVADRATIANMAPEYGATCGFFPIDEKTIEYLRLSGRESAKIKMIEDYAKNEMLWNEYEEDLKFTELIELDLSTVKASLAGPKRPQDKCYLEDVYSSLINGFEEANAQERFEVKGTDYDLGHGDVVIAAITSCTNTSNPSVLICAGLLAKKAVERGLIIKPYVKTSLAPGSKVVTEYLKNSGLQEYLDQLGFHTVGYGCTTCIGNSGPLKLEIEDCIRDTINSGTDLCLAGVLSGNRNFEGRIHPLVKANYLASPPLVIAFAIAGTLNIDMTTNPLGKGTNGTEIYLKDIWPSDREVSEYIDKFVTQSLFEKNYQTIFNGDEFWRSIEIEDNNGIYKWDPKSTYVKKPPYFEEFSISRTTKFLSDIKSARILALLGDSITTDHISPAGNIKDGSPAALYLKSNGVLKDEFNSYGSRRGNHEVMIRGTFANTRLKNEIVTPKVGGYTKYFHNGNPIETTIFDASVLYKDNGTIPLVIIAGKEYGSGSSRDWAAKGVALLGVKAVIAESFERIHRSNLIGMGVIPLTFTKEETRLSLGIKGDSTIDIVGLSKIIKPKQEVECIIKSPDNKEKKIKLLVRIDTDVELETLLAGGILPKVLRKLI